MVNAAGIYIFLGKARSDITISIKKKCPKKVNYQP